MGDMGDMYRDFDEIKKERKAKRENKNMQIIRDWIEEDKKRSLFIVNKPHSILFRFPDKPKADFYPTTNKWRSRNKTYYGDAKQFLKWHERQ